MNPNKKECKCPLCGRLAQALELKPGQRIECKEKCTTYEISEGLKQLLASGTPEDKGFAPYLSDAAQRATHGAGPNILSFCLQLNEKNYPEIAADEKGFQDLVQPVVKYLKSKGIVVKGEGEHSFVYLELLLPNADHTTTLKVERSLFMDRTPKELESYCRDFNIAGELAKTPRGGSLEIDKSAAIRQTPKG
jgi:hypothetical protein